MEIQTFFWPLFSILVSVVLIVFLRWFGRIPQQLVGPDLNIFAYGFTCDIMIDVLQNEAFWPNYDPFWGLTKTQILASIFLLNVVLMACNFRLANYISRIDDSESKEKKFGLKFLSFFLGIFSAVMYVLCRGAWE